MEHLPGYDEWLLPDDPIFLPTMCRECETTYPATEEFVEGDPCPNCDEPLEIDYMGYDDPRDEPDYWY